MIQIAKACGLVPRMGLLQAPFFIVRANDGQEIVYTAFLKFLKEVLQANPSEAEEARALLENNPDLYV